MLRVKEAEPSSNDFEESYFESVYDAEYDFRNPEYKFRSYLREIVGAAPPARFKTLFEIGSAYGSFLKQARHEYEVFGSDISKHAVRQAQARLPEISIIHSGLLEIRIDRRFDVVTCFDVLEHIPDLEESFAKVHSLMNEGGRFMFTVPVYDTPVGALVRMLDKDPTHLHKISRYDWLRTARENNFEVLAWKGIWRYYLASQRTYLHHIQGISRTFSPAIIVICAPLSG